MLIEKQTYTNVKSVAGNRTIRDLQLVRCEFIGSNLSQFDDPELSLVVRDVTATRCVAKRSSIDGVRFEDVLVDGLTTSNGPTLYGCTFRHVTLKGRIGLIKIIGPNFSLPQDVQDAFAASIARYYQEVDWALDISQAEFDSTPDLFFVPGDLVRRDPETQYLLRRDAFDGLDLSTLPIPARVAAGRFESTPFDAIVAVAAKRSKTFAEDKAALDELRTMGLAE
jgi:hypothetical protein